MSATHDVSNISNKGRAKVSLSEYETMINSKRCFYFSVSSLFHTPTVLIKPWMESTLGGRSLRWWRRFINRRSVGRSSPLSKSPFGGVMRARNREDELHSLRAPPLLKKKILNPPALMSFHICQVHHADCQECSHFS